MKKVTTKKNSRNTHSNISTFAQWDELPIIITLTNGDRCVVKDGKETITISNIEEVDLLDYVDQIKTSYTINENCAIASFNISIPKLSQTTNWDGSKNFIIRESVTIEPVTIIEYVIINFWDPGNTTEEGFNAVRDADTKAVDYSKISRNLIATKKLLTTESLDIYTTNDKSKRIFPMSENGMVVGFKQTSDNILIPLPLYEHLGLADDHIEKFQIDQNKLSDTTINIDCDMLRFDYLCKGYDDSINGNHMIKYKSKDGSIGDLSEVVVGIIGTVFGTGIKWSTPIDDITRDNLTHTIKHICTNDYYNFCHISESSNLKWISPQLLRYCTLHDLSSIYEPDSVNTYVPIILFREVGDKILPIVPIRELYKYSNAPFVDLGVYDYYNVYEKNLPDNFDSYLEIPSNTSYCYGDIGQLLTSEQEQGEWWEDQICITRHLDKIITNKKMPNLTHININCQTNKNGIHPVSYGDLNISNFPKLEYLNIYNYFSLPSDMNWSNLKLNKIIPEINFYVTDFRVAPTVPENQFETYSVGFANVDMSNVDKLYFSPNSITLHVVRNRENNLCAELSISGSDTQMILSEKCLPANFINFIYPEDNNEPVYIDYLFYSATIINHENVDEVSEWIRNFLLRLTDNKKHKLIVYYYDVFDRIYSTNLFTRSSITKLPDDFFEFIDTNTESIYALFYSSPLTVIPSQDNIVNILKSFPNLNDISRFACGTNLSHIPELWLDEELSNKLTNTTDAFGYCNKADNYYRCPVSYGGPSTIAKFDEATTIKIELIDRHTITFYIDIDLKLAEFRDNQLALLVDVFDPKDLSLSINNNIYTGETITSKLQFIDNNRLDISHRETELSSGTEYPIEIKWRNSSKVFHITTDSSSGGSSGGSGANINVLTDPETSTGVDWSSLRNTNPITNDGIVEFKSYTLNNK